MKNLFLLFLLLPVFLQGQITKGTGISYFDSIPNVAPSLPRGTEIAFSIALKKLYRWDRTSSTWIEMKTSTDSLARTVLASGLFNEYAVPFGGSTGKLDQSAAFQFVLGQLQANSFSTLGSAGAGYVGLSPQSSVPATPASGIRVYADASGRFGWIGTNGYTRVFDASGITANRIFKLQNKTYTLADSADVSSLSASLPSAYFPLLGGTLTGTGGAGFVGFPSQTVSPGTPTSGLNVYAQGSSFNWKGTDGYERQFASTLTGGRTYTLQNKSYTLADQADVTALQSTVAGLGSTYFPLVGGSLTGTAGAGYFGAIAQSSAPSTPASGFRFYADASGRLAWKGTNGFVRVFDGTANTADRAYTLPDASGTFDLIDLAQTITAIKTFAPSGTGAAGFIYSSTTRPAHPFGTVITAQRDAMTGMAAGDVVYNSNLKRINIWDVSWLAVPTMASGGIGNNEIVTGDANGNLQSSVKFKHTAGAPILYMQGTAPRIEMIGDATNTGTKGVYFYQNGLSSWVQSVPNGGGDYGNLELGANGSTKLTINTVAIQAAANFPFRADEYTVNTGSQNAAGTSWISFNYNEKGTRISSTRLGSYGSGNFKIHVRTGVSSADAGDADVVFYIPGSTAGAKSGKNVSINSGVTDLGYSLGVNGDFGINPGTTVLSSTGDLSGGGYFFRQKTGTYNNSTTAAAGTVSAASLNSLDGGIVTATNAMTYTNLATLRVGAAPGAGTNVTITNPYAFWVASGNSLFGGNITATGTVSAPTVIHNDAALRTWGANDYSGTIFFRYGRNASITSNSDNMTLSTNSGFNFTSGGVAALGISSTQITALFGSTFSYTMGTGMTIKGRLGVSTGALYANNITSVPDGAIFTDGGLFIYAGHTFYAASTIFDVQSTVKGARPIPAMTTAQISAISSPALFLQAASTTDERIHLKRTSGFFQIAFTQDLKRDTSYQITNTNLDISGQTTNFKNRYHTVRIATAVTAAATANNVITMPVPHADLLGINFKVSVVDISGDSDISQLSFGTDGVDGYLSNGDGTYALTQNLYPGLGVYVSVAWDQNKSAYRWFLQ